MQQLQPIPQYREYLEQLYRERTLTPFGAGSNIPLKSNEILIVCRGIVQLSVIHDSGDETLLGLAGPTTPIGLPLTIVDPYQAVALTHVDVLRLSLSEVESNDILAAGLCRQMMARLRQSEAWLALTGQRPVASRLSHLIDLLSDEFGQESEAGPTRITVRLTHQQLANAIGTTRVTVTRLLSNFRKEGWLSFDRQRHMLVTR
ncbi:MAG: Crp/Fnr family transcriptional regulator [Cyanobacteria bacterium P01_A01_bin.3]